MAASDGQSMFGLPPFLSPLQYQHIGKYLTFSEFHKLGILMSSRKRVNSINSKPYLPPVLQNIKLIFFFHI